MNSPMTSDSGAIGFAERVLTLLDQGRFTSTYKYAVFLGLIDLVLEQSSKYGVPPTSVTTRQLAEKVIEIYWLHASVYEGSGKVLIQNKGRTGTQAELVRLVEDFRRESGVGNYAPYFKAKLTAPKTFTQLLNKVEWKLIEMPLPRLQKIGSQKREFIYSYNWEEGVSKALVSAYQKGSSLEFDNRIHFKGNAADYFIRLNGLLRPLIQREWAIKVAQLNQLEESTLQSFLFGKTRASAAKLCGPLSDLQSGRCFYCEKPIGTSKDNSPEVDHFIPWARYPDDNITNYVVAHSKCNRDKSDFLAAGSHLTNWGSRLIHGTVNSDLKSMAEEYHWKCSVDSMLGVASAIYTHLQPEVELWRLGKEFEPLNTDEIMAVFC